MNNTQNSAMPFLSNESLYISLVIPCFNEEPAIPLFYDEVIKIILALKTRQEIEFIFVDDGSKNNTLNVLRELSAKDSRKNIALFTGMCLFTGLNYTGQRLVVLNKKNTQEK